MKGFLVLEDGTVFRGESVGAEGFAFGEAVFTTAMTGYQEVVTDPSFAEQIVCFTAPMVGNYGVAPQRSESGHVFARAAIMREARGPAWTDWLVERSIPALSGIDTRSLVIRLRERGAMRAAVVIGECSDEEALAAVQAQPSMEGRALAAEVSTREPYVASDSGRARIAVVDYGCKRSILKRVAANGAAVDVFPHDTDADTLASYDGVLLSPGPGDPAPLTGEVQRLQELLGRVLVTSQNHGFAVAPGEGRGVTHVSLYDGTVEGLEFPELRARSVQFHPEAGPGPHDAWPLLERWVEEVSGFAAAA